MRFALTLLHAALAGLAVHPDDRLPTSLMLGRSSTDVSLAFSACRLHQANPLIKACEARVGGHRGVALFLYDSAQAVERVDVVFPVQAKAQPALSQARALRALLTKDWRHQPSTDAGHQAWTVALPHLAGEVRLEAQQGGFVAAGTFRDPSFKPAYF